MKQVCISTVLIMAVIFPMRGQVTIGSGKVPESYSVLELDSNKGGVRLNQLNQSEKQLLTTELTNSSIPNLTHGLTIFDMDANKIQYWDSEKWAQVLSLEANDDAEGLEGQFLRSKGAGEYPEWTTLNIPTVQTGEFYLYTSKVTKDTIGVDLPFITHNTERYIEDMILNGTSQNWVELKDLEMKINIPDIPKKPEDPVGKVYSRLALQLQTGAQMVAGPKTITIKTKDTNNNDINVVIKDNAWISFTIGIFIGNANDGYKLKQVRSTRLEASGINSFFILTLIGAVDNLPPGEQTIKVAVKRRTHVLFMDDVTDDNKLLTVGKPIPQAPNYNNFMAQSFLRSDLYVVYD